MGIRSGSNIKILRRGTTSTLPLSSAPIMPIAASAATVAPTDTTGGMIFRSEISSLKNGSVGQINRIYKNLYPVSGNIQKSPFSDGIKQVLDAFMNRSPQQSHTGYIAPLLDAKKYQDLDTRVLDILDDFKDEPGIRYFDAPNRLSSGISGKLGKYTIYLIRKNHQIDMTLHDTKSNAIMASMEYVDSQEPWFVLDSDWMESQVDSKLFHLLSWSLLENESLFRGILNLIE